MERVKGIEPSRENSKSLINTSDSESLQADYTQIRAQILGELGPDLTRVVTVWSKLPAPLKAAILAIVNSSEDSR